MRRIVMALLGTALGTALLVGLKAQGGGPGADAVAAAPLQPLSSGATGPSGMTLPSGAAEPGRTAGPSLWSSTPPNGSTSITQAASATTSATMTSRAIIGNPYPAGKYGDVQLKVIMTGTRIDDIKVLQMSTRPLNAPTLLRQEALAKQSADLTNVSGATYTSQAYMQSLQSALTKA